MLDKYGENDEEIPESDSYTPRTPRSPAYTSMFDDEGQRGGGGGGGRRQSSGKYVPQIPMGVLENYLSSKYGKSGVSMAGIGSGIMTGGSGGANTNVTTMPMGLPTMNIPVVATMPMAGMMPIQQAGGAVAQQGQNQTQQQQQQNGQGASGQQTGGSATMSAGPEPNAQGVKTFSIKL
jgi:hypothetical protein